MHHYFVRPNSKRLHKNIKNHIRTFFQHDIRSGKLLLYLHKGKIVSLTHFGLKNDNTVLVKEIIIRENKTVHEPLNHFNKIIGRLKSKFKLMPINITSKNIYVSSSNN